MWRLRDPADRDRFTALLRSLDGNVPGLRDLEVGTQLEAVSDGFDVVLISRFDRLEDLEAYRAHPFHVEVASQLATMRTERAVVDFAK
jgi:heme-degrading monooxygenase HmoA